MNARSIVNIMMIHIIKMLFNMVVMSYLLFTKIKDVIQILYLVLKIGKYV